MIPNVDVRYCGRHAYNNFKQLFPGLLLGSYFWQATKSYDESGHKEAMQQIKDINIGLEILDKDTNHSLGRTFIFCDY